MLSAFEVVLQVGGYMESGGGGPQNGPAGIVSHTRMSRRRKLRWGLKHYQRPLIRVRCRLAEDEAGMGWFFSRCAMSW